MPAFHNIAAILAHNFAGHFSADSDAMQAMYAFVENDENTMADRASALRHIAVEALGLDGEDAGENVPDATYVQIYMSSL